LHINDLAYGFVVIEGNELRELRIVFAPNITAFVFRTAVTRLATAPRLGWGDLRGRGNFGLESVKIVGSETIELENETIRIKRGRTRRRIKDYQFKGIALNNGDDRVDDEHLQHFKQQSVRISEVPTSRGSEVNPWNRSQWKVRST